jgi:UDP-N-acetylmuramoyl-tripeptide--D-alanyl-D-alanine ligase
MGEKFKWTLSDILKATGGHLAYGNESCRFSAVAIDSRTIGADDLFVAIRGTVHDGHRFAAEVIQKGVRGLLIQRETAFNLPHATWRDQGITCVRVTDTTHALGDLAAYNRQRAGIPVVAITGSNGKTSTRKMTTAVMQRKFRVLAPQGNFNNDIGLPLTLLACEDDHGLAVLELGMNHFGEIRRLGEICRPNIGLITNIGPAHLEGVGSIEGVAQAKGELLEEVAADGTLVLNAEDEHLRRLATQTDRRVVYFGFSEKAEVRAESLRDEAGGTRFRLILPTGNISVRLALPGRFMILNALAAAAAGHLMGLSPDQIKDGLEHFEPARGRINILKSAGGIQVIDDTYNANLASMQAALDLLAHLKGKRRGIFVAGDMLELGDQSERLHRELGRLAAAKGVARLYVTGRFAPAVAAAAQENGLPAEQVQVGSKEQLIEALKEELAPGDWVLVKGSRAMAMETVVEGIKGFGTH